MHIQEGSASSWCQFPVSTVGINCTAARASAQTGGPSTSGLTISGLGRWECQLMPPYCGHATSAWHPYKAACNCIQPQSCMHHRGLFPCIHPPVQHYSKGLSVQHRKGLEQQGQPACQRSSRSCTSLELCRSLVTHVQTIIYTRELIPGLDP